MTRARLKHDDRGYLPIGLLAANYGVSQQVIRKWAERVGAERRYDTQGRVHYRLQDIRRHAEKVAA